MSRGSLSESRAIVSKSTKTQLMPEGRPPGYIGSPSACMPTVGRLLRTLTAAKPAGRFYEHGTGAGVGTAWIASGLSSDATLISAEKNPDRAAAMAKLFAEWPNVEIRAGNWHEVLADEAPADLIFMDATPRRDLKPTSWDKITAPQHMTRFRSATPMRRRASL